MQNETELAAKICVFASWPIVTVTIETAESGEDEDDVYFNAGGQGIWVARMAAELGADVTFCGPFGGHAGIVCQHLILSEGIGLRPVGISSANGSYVDDRRDGDRTRIATHQSPHLTRHEVDDLYSAGLAEGLAAGTIVISGQIGERNLPAERVASMVRDLHDNGVHVIADLSGPTLTALDGGVSILKVAHDELAEMGLAKADEEGEIVKAMRKLNKQVAENVVVSMADRGALALMDGDLYRIEQPALRPVDTTGAGDSMTAGLAVARAQGLGCEETLRLAAGAGALNVTRRGRGTGMRQDVHEVAKLVKITPYGS